MLLPILLAAVVTAHAASGGYVAPAYVQATDPLDRRISVQLAGMALSDAIRLVAQKGRLNVLLEDDMRQPVSADFRDVKLGEALDTLFDMGGVAGIRRGGVLAVMTRKKAFERGLFTDAARVFQLRYANALRIADFLNTSALTRPYIGLQGSAGGQGAQQMLEIAKADARTNSVLVMGTTSEIALAERTVRALDRPLGQRIFKLSHANAVDVASLLNATLFNTGSKQPVETVKADVESVSEGQGAQQTGTGVAVATNASQLRMRTLATQQLPIEAKASIAVPDSRTNAVIVMGSPEILAIVAATIPQLDRAAAQVAIEVEVIELNTSDALELGASLTTQSGTTVIGGDPANASNPGWSIAYDPAATVQQVFRARINALMRDRRAKLVAHPTIVASDNTEAQINIVDEVIKGMRISNQGVSSNGQPLVVSEPIYGVAGVMLNILPKIGEDARVTLRLHPTVASVRETQRDALNNPITLLSRRELVAQQVIVPSGTSLALGGLTQTNNVSQANKLPLVGDIPFLGALFNSSSWTNSGAELMILVTPRVVVEKG